MNKYKEAREMIDKVALELECSFNESLSKIEGSDFEYLTRLVMAKILKEVVCVNLLDDHKSGLMGLFGELAEYCLKEDDQKD